MTDEDYKRLLRALAVKHLARQGRRGGAHYVLHESEHLRGNLEEVSGMARLLRVTEDQLLKVVQDHPVDSPLRDTLRAKLLESSPIEKTRQALEKVGILDAFDQAGPVIFAQLRREAIPQEDFQLFREAGYTEDEIEILIAIAIHEARTGLITTESVSRQLADAAELFNDAVLRLQQIPPQGPQVTEVKKRKIFNGIGKVLGGCIGGLGNALLATGTIVAPNPATAAGAIASAAVAVPAIMSGVGDLRGE